MISLGRINGNRTEPQSPKMAESGTARSPAGLCRMPSFTSCVVMIRPAGLPPRMMTTSGTRKRSGRICTRTEIAAQNRGQFAAIKYATRPCCITMIDFAHVALEQRSLDEIPVGVVGVAQVIAD